MSHPSGPAQMSWSRQRIVGFVLVTLAWFACIAITWHNHRSVGFGIDYRSVYSSSRCLLVGCNPYSAADTRAQFLGQGASLAETRPEERGPFSQFYAGYPPTTLFYLMPLAALRWYASWSLYLLLTVTLFWGIALLYSDICSEYSPIWANFLLAGLLFTQIWSILLSQPTLLVANLCCFGIWTLLQKRYVWLGIFCFALSLILKPHFGFFPLLYFFLATSEYRKRVWQIAGVAVLLCVPVLLWATVHPDSSRHWMQNYSVNLKGVAQRGNLSDPGPTNPAGGEQIADLQTIVSNLRDDPHFYNPVVWAFSLVLLAVWAYPVWRLKPSREKDLMCLAAIACFGLLPVYHRVYDTLLLVVIYPALGLILARVPRLRAVVIGVGLWFTFMISIYYARIIHRPSNDAQIKHFGSLAYDGILRGLMERPLAWGLLGMTIFLLFAIYRLPRELGLENR